MPPQRRDVDCCRALGYGGDPVVAAELLAQRRLVDDADPGILRFGVKRRGDRRRLNLVDLAAQFSVETIERGGALAADFHLDAASLEGRVLRLVGPDDDLRRLLRLLRHAVVDDAHRKQRSQKYGSDHFLALLPFAASLRAASVLAHGAALRPS